MIAELDRLSSEADEATFGKMTIYAGLGEMNKAFEIIEARAGGWSSPLLELRLDPRFDVLRSDPRYDDLVKRRFNL